MIPNDGLAMMLRALVAQGVNVGLYTNEEPPRTVGEVEAPLPEQHAAADAWTVDDVQGQIETRIPYTFRSRGNMGLMRGYYLESGGRLVLVQPFMHPVPFMTNMDKIHVRPCIRASDWAAA